MTATDPAAPALLKIDFVSDVVCPWCAIGLHALESALQDTGLAGRVALHFQPFELNPQMPAEGEDIDEHLARKYGATPEQGARNREAIRARGAALGFEFNMQARSRIHNTFSAHRLLHWAGLQGAAPQQALKHALLAAYFTEGRNPDDARVLRDCAAAAGLDADAADAVLASGAYAEEVRAAEAFYAGHGIQAVPSVIIDDRHLIQGGQPPEVFAQALRRIAAEGRPPGA